MSLKKFLFYIIESDGRSNYVVNGVVSSKGTPTPLPQAPVGWEDIAFGWGRDNAMHGLTRSFSKELSFVADGAAILREAYYNTNPDRQLFFLVQRLTLEYTTTYKWKYETIYKGELDFTTANDKPEEAKFNIQIMQGGLSKLLDAAKDTVLSVPFDDDSGVLRHDGVIISNTVQVITEEQYGEAGSFYFQNHVLRLNLTTSETGFFGGARSTARTQINNSNSAIRGTGEYFFKATTATTVSVEFNLDFVLQYTPASPAPNPAAVYKIVVRQIDESNVSTYQEELFSRTQAEGFNGSFNATGSFDIDVAVGDELYLYAFCNVEGVSGDDQIRTVYSVNENTLFKASFSYRHPETFPKCFTRATAWRKLCKQIFGYEDYAVSTLFASDDRLLFSGDSLRGIESPVLQTTISDFLKDADTDLFAGLGIEQGAAAGSIPAGERAVIETRTHFYDESDPVILGEAKELSIIYAKDWVSNTIKSGWKEPTTEDVNGKYEFNASQQGSLPNKRVKKEYNLVSPYKAGPVEIEMLRINLDGKTTTDDDRDNDCFVIVGEPADTSITGDFAFEEDGNVITKPTAFSVAPGSVITFTGTASNNSSFTVVNVSGNSIEVSEAVTDESTVSCTATVTGGPTVYNIKRESFDNDDDPEDFGVPSPTTWYNYDLSPKRKLLRHGRWIASMMHNYGTEKVKFESGTRNISLKTIQGAVTIQENKDESISALGAKIFIPFLLSFKAEAPVGLAELMEDGPNRCFTFTYNGNTYKGFNIKCGLSPNTEEEQEFSLLSVPGNDLTLINS